MHAIFAFLLVIGCLSPLATFLALFQQKEWRLDRLAEHLRREGLIRQLWGTVRPVLALLFLISDIVLLRAAQTAGNPVVAGRLAMLLYATHGLWLFLFAVLTVYQSMRHAQRLPVRTQKALAIGGLAFLFTLIAATAGSASMFLPMLLLLSEPALVLCAWAIFLPLDAFLKNRTYLAAETARMEWDNATVIAIAGSVGKTTTKELIKHLLSDLHPLTTPEHVNTEMGVAQWMLAQDATHTGTNVVCIMEMGAYRTGEIATMCSFVKPTIGVMTALGSDHLALFGSEEAIIDANAELLRALPENGHAFLYADNDATRSLLTIPSCDVTLAGDHPDADIRATYIEQTDGGLKLSIGSHTSTIALHGLHNVGNILLAVAVARSLGIADERIHQLLESFHPLLHTFHVRHEHGILLVDDTYNSSRLSIRAALDWAKTRSEHPRVLLLSGLLETGVEEERFLEELGTLAKHSIERAIFLSPKGASAFARGFGKDVEVLTLQTEPVHPGSLLLCLGRMPLSTIQHLLPTNH